MPPPRLQTVPTASARVQSGQLTPRTPHSRAGRAEEAVTEFELEQYGDGDGDGDDRGHTLQQQSEPLLASSTSDTFPPSGLRARGDDDLKTRRTNRDLRRVVRWLIANWGLIFGSALALLLFLALVLSYKRPDALLSAVGVTGTSPSPTPATKQDDTLTPHLEHIISYENYTRFPLDPLEYKAECHKIMGDIMGAMEYWSGEEDVVHHDKVDPGPYPAPEGLPTQICSKTITYMLDGHVGLLADLALMAQAAGLARKVKLSLLNFVVDVYAHSRPIMQTGRTFLVDDTYWNRGKSVAYSFSFLKQQLKSTAGGQTTFRTFAHANQDLNQNAAHHLRRVSLHFTCA